MYKSAFSGKRRLLMWLTTLLTIGFVANSLISYFVSRNSIRHQIVTNELPLTSDNVYSEIQNDLTRTVFISSMMAHDTFLHDWVTGGELDAAKMTRYLSAIQQEYGAITSFFVSEQSRVYYTEKGVLKKVSEDSPVDIWYFRTRRLTVPYEINTDPDEANKNALTIFINYQVRDHQGKLIGVAGVGQTVDSLRKLIDNYQSRYQRTVFLVDKKGHVVLHGNDFPPAVENIHAIDGLGNYAKTILRSDEGMYQYERNGEVYQLSTRFIPELGWYLLVNKSESAALTDIFNTLFLNLALSMFVALVIVLLTRMSINRHQARLRLMVEKHTSELNAALEEASASNKVQNQMLAYASHDLRIPLNNIIHYTHLLSDDPGSSAMEYQTIIEHSILQQMEMIDELVEYARGELNQLKLLPAPTYIHSFLQGIAEQGELMAAHFNNRFEMVVENNVPPVMVFDPQRLKQVLNNLLSNAAKFTEGGDIRLQVDVLPETDAGDSRLRFTVSDTGPGIPEGDQQRILMPYQRSTSEMPGSGLGLAIVRQVVEKMGGTLEMESTYGHGTSFWFEIAMQVAQEKDVLQSAHAIPAATFFGTGKSVLLVEDDPAMRDYLLEILSLADFDVECTNDTEEATKRLASQAFDAVLISGNMPQQKAWELLQRCYESASINVSAIILCSATPLQYPDSALAELKFDAFLLKPISAEKLLRELQRSLDRHDSR